MIARLYSSAVVGVEGIEVEVEVDAQEGEKRTFIVGLPDTAIKESAQRVSSAIANSAYPVWEKTFIVNLAPADLKKQGPSFDLPIALGMIAAGSRHGLLVPEWSITGELALDGTIRPIRGALSIALEAKRQGRSHIMLPLANAEEAAVVEDITVIPVTSLREAWEILTGERPKVPFVYDKKALFSHKDHYEVDFEEIKGQPFARRALEIAAAGGHNILLCGSPGSGKSMFAQRLPTILPELTEDEAIETSKIHSVCGLLRKGEGLLLHRPFRAPHHTISDIGLMGGGAVISPGEISLAHKGVLFLDELPEFKRQTLETLRQPLEAGHIVISRASGTFVFPCQFMLMAAMNPCPCGYRGDPKRSCRCQPGQIANYKRRLSGPLLDRFDLMIEVPPVDLKSLSQTEPGESSATIRARVNAARARQTKRFSTHKSCTHNALMSGKLIHKHCTLSPSCQQLMNQAIDDFALSARGHDRILKVARTIADLDNAEHITEDHLYEAIQMRQFETHLR